jgi:hypothetical protein
MQSGTCPQSLTRCAQRSFAEERVNSLPCSYDLMCQSQSLFPAVAFHSLGSPCSLDHPLLVSGTFPTLSDANLFLDAWTHTPALAAVLVPVSSHCASAFPQRLRGRQFGEKSIQRLLYGPYFRGCSHFFMFRPPGLLATRVVPAAGAFAFRAAVTFTSEHRAGRYLRARRIC